MTTLSPPPAPARASSPRACPPSPITTSLTSRKRTALIAVARRQAPIAMGPHVPEVLSYELVRTVLRDPRFITAADSALTRKGSPPVGCGSGRSQHPQPRR